MDCVQARVTLHDMAITHTIDVLIIGAGHAGLAMSGLMTASGREHLVVERRDTLGGGWQDRWDAFRLVTPNWTASFPGWAYDGPDPDGFMTRDEIAARVARYAEVVGAPVALGTDVERLARLRSGAFRANTNRGDIVAREVVVATGSYHTPRLPTMAARISDRITQLHSHNYRNERALPAGAVLIVGSGQTGLQLAEELFAAGRTVYVSVGSAGRVPRRYRGRDIFSWLVDVMRHGAAYGVTFPTADQLPDPRRRFNAMPALSGPRRRPRHQPASVRGRRDAARGTSRGRRRRARDVRRRPPDQPRQRGPLLRRALPGRHRPLHRARGHRRDGSSGRTSISPLVAAAAVVRATAEAAATAA
jgi:cation diffusion facilitator CzcD-associated flavoprotein CzcO